jgi:hypothetical protein
MVVLLMFALALALLTISPTATDAVVVIGTLVALSMCMIALSYNLRKIRLMGRIGKEAYLEQERAGMSQRPASVLFRKFVRKRRQCWRGSRPPS